ncbi:MAG: Hsp20/alpha crystallin family protein [Desulfovibrionaceae bacterium]|nr:Hsp20/alpha crystallin family protein [Desulfovibrionaceae bacterium]
MVIDFGSFYNFPRLVNTMLAEMDAPSAALRAKTHFPPLNISETEEAIYVKALIPGAAIEDIELTISDSILTIRGEIQPKQGRYHRQERPTGPFSRVININVPIELNKVSASMKNGVLKVSLPKLQASRPRTINIQPS